MQCALLGIPSLTTLNSPPSVMQVLPERTKLNLLYPQRKEANVVPRDTFRDESFKRR